MVTRSLEVQYLNDSSMGLPQLYLLYSLSIIAVACCCTAKMGPRSSLDCNDPPRIHSDIRTAEVALHSGHESMVSHAQHSYCTFQYHPKSEWHSGCPLSTQFPPGCMGGQASSHFLSVADVQRSFKPSRTTSSFILPVPATWWSGQPSMGLSFSCDCRHR